MKPSDHPEFFRLPPPIGASRESAIELDGAGQFWHEGERVEHLGMKQALAQWVTRHPDNGRYILSNGYDWVYFTVADTPFFVSGVAGPHSAPLLQIFDGTTEPLRPELLEEGRGGALYTKIKAASFPARFTQKAQLDLADWLVTAENGAVGLKIGDQLHSIPNTRAGT